MHWSVWGLNRCVLGLFGWFIVFSFVFIEVGPGKIDPNPSRQVAAVGIALTQESVVVDFNCAFDFALFPSQFDDFQPSVVSFGITVRADPLVCQRIKGLVAF